MSLFKAIEQSNPAALRRALAAGADANATDAQKRTPLIVASKYGRGVCVATLLQHPGVDTMAVSVTDGSAAHAAISGQISRGHNSEILRALLDAAPKLAYVNDNDGVLPLWKALNMTDSDERYACVHALIDAGADIDALEPKVQGVHSDASDTPIKAVTRRGLDYELAELLVHAGADLTRQDNDGNGLLHEAWTNQCLVQLFLDFGVDPEAFGEGVFTHLGELVTGIACKQEDGNYRTGEEMNMVRFLLSEEGVITPQHAAQVLGWLFSFAEIQSAGDDVSEIVCSLVRCGARNFNVIPCHIKGLEHLIDVVEEEHRDALRAKCVVG